MEGVKKVSNLADTPESHGPSGSSEPEPTGQVSFQLLMLRSLDRIETRLDRVDDRFDRMDERFARIDARFDRMDERFGRIDARLDHMDQKIDGLSRWAVSTIVAVLVGAGAVVVTLVSQHP